MKKSVALLAYLDSAEKFWVDILFTKMHRYLANMRVLKMEKFELSDKSFQCTEEVYRKAVRFLIYQYFKPFKDY